MEPFTVLTSRVVLLPVDNIDTDQIIPARYLKGTEKAGLGAHLFADWRYQPDGSPKPGFVLNQAEAAGGRILLAGDNFACGSSREHAPWALTDYGFRAVISTSIADIFRSNALKNGLLPVVLDPTAYQALLDLVNRDPNAEITIDLADPAVVLPGGERLPFPIDPFSQACLLKGTDELGYLLSFSDRIEGYEEENRE